MWLVVVDATSKWAEVIPVRQATSELTIRALEAIFARFGLPMQIFSDNGTAFMSDEFCTFCERKGIRQIFSTPFHPRSNGEAERMVRTFKSMLKKANPAKTEVMSAMSDMLLAYHMTPHATTGVSPHELLFKATPRTLMHHIHPAVESRVVGKQLKQRDASMMSHSEHLFLMGERVWVKDFRARFPNKWVAGTVVARRSPLSYVVQVGSEAWRRHTDQMRGAEWDQFQPDQAPVEQHLCETLAEGHPGNCPIEMKGSREPTRPDGCSKHQTMNTTHASSPDLHVNAMDMHVNARDTHAKAMDTHMNATDAAPSNMPDASTTRMEQANKRANSGRSYPKCERQAVTAGLRDFLSSATLGRVVH